MAFGRKEFIEALEDNLGHAIGHKIPRFWPT